MSEGKNETIIPYAFAKKHGVFLESQDGLIKIFCVQVPKFEVISELSRRLIDEKMEVCTISRSDFDSRLRGLYEVSTNAAADSVVANLDDNLDLARLAEEVPEVTDLLDQSDDAPIIRLINALITQAVREGVSDIHLEVFETESSARYRIDGLLREVLSLKRELHNAMISRLKVMSKLDIAEKRLPQDGRMSLRVGEFPLDVRVSTLPTQHGERAVLRLLEKQGERLDLVKLGMPPPLLNQFKTLINKPYGILLVTGPTGSGKTTTLYSALNELDRERLNILTVEDPIEYDLANVSQTQINEKVGLSFAKGLRSILRQDPDIVLVGEIRDFETAQIATQASLTGHLVLSTLHTNTAIGAVTRLVDMGIEPYLLASSVIAVLAQRLVRQVCQDCVSSKPPNEAQLNLMEAWGVDRLASIPHPQGCHECGHNGYKGRIGIYELIEVDDQIKSFIHNQSSEQMIQEYVRQDVNSIVQNGMQLVAQGATTIEEILRVTQN